MIEPRYDESKRNKFELTMWKRDLNGNPTHKVNYETNEGNKLAGIFGDHRRQYPINGIKSKKKRKNNDMGATTDKDGVSILKEINKDS